MNIGSLFSASTTAQPQMQAGTTTAREQRQQALSAAKLNDARAAVETLKQRTSSASAEKKAAAKKKIEEIKARLQMLQMAMIGDPKGAARMAAALARELGAAVKAYAAAGGSAAGMGATSGPPATDGTAAAPDTASTEVPAETEVDIQAEAPPAETDDAETARSANPYQQAIDAAQARINEQARRHGESQADRETLDEVKRLAARIKAMARQAANKAGGPSEEAERAVARMDREISDAVQALPAAGVSLTI